MISFLRHVLDAGYLYALQADVTAQWARVHTVWLLALLGGAALSAIWFRRTARSGRSPLAPRVATASLVLSAVLLVLRFLVLGPLSARIWWISAWVLGLLTAIAHCASRQCRLGPARPLARALALRLSPEDALLPPLVQSVLVASHVVGLMALSRHGILGLVLLGVCAVCVVISSRPRLGQRGQRGLRLELLTPLAVPYAGALLRWLVGESLGIDPSPYAAFPYPDLWWPLFDLRVLSLIAAGWMILSTGALVFRSSRTRPALAWLGALPLGLGLAWYFTTALVHVSQGASGSDPSCYLQMAIDLVQTGSPLHAFPIVGMVREARVPVWPAVHVGYHVPTEGSLAATVWPIGWPMLLAPLYWLGGERLALLGAPLALMASAAATWALAYELWPTGGQRSGRLVGGLAAALVLTSTETILRSLVPMADAATQLLSVLTLLFLVRARNRDSWHWSALAGAAFALAFSVRHAQVWLALALLPMSVLGGRGWVRRRQHVVAFLLAALVCLLPDTVYRVQTFGALWSVESTEWSLLSWRHIPASLARVADGLLRKHEFGYLLPFAVGGALLPQNFAHRPTRVAMLLSFVGVLLFNMSYSAVRLRDLIPVFPWICLWAARGLVGFWEWASRGSSSRATIALWLILLALFARGADALAMPWRGGVRTFGYVSAAERSAYEEIRDELPSNALVATGLSSAAVERYADRPTVRPASWTQDEFARFAAAASRRGQHVYLLDDGDEMHDVLSRVDARFTLDYVKELALTRFGPGGDRTGEGTPLYRLAAPKPSFRRP